MGSVARSIVRGMLSAGQRITSWAHGLVAQGYEGWRTQRQNKEARGIANVGEVSASDLVAGTGRSIVLGAPEGAADAVIAGLAASSLALGVPVAVLSEGLGSVAEALFRMGWKNVEEADAQKPFYEPLACLSEAEAVAVASRALSLTPGAPQEASSYLAGIIRVISLMGGCAMTRSIDSFPHARTHEVVEALELKGALGAAEASALRADLDVAPSCRAFVGRFFREAVSEGALLAGAGPCLAPRGIVDLARRGPAGALVLDVVSGQASALHTLALAEIEACSREGLGLTVVIRARSVAHWDVLGQVLRSAPSLNWLIVAEEALEFFSSEEELRRWVAPSTRLVCFGQGRASAELVSKTFGEYDKVELSHTRAQGGCLGILGAGTQGSSVTRSLRRESVVRPEELFGLGDGHFFVQDSNGFVGEGSARW